MQVSHNKWHSRALFSVSSRRKVLPSRTPFLFQRLTCECPFLYFCCPFRQHGLGRPDLLHDSCVIHLLGDLVALIPIHGFERVRRMGDLRRQDALEAVIKIWTIRTLVPRTVN